MVAVGAPYEPSPSDAQAGFSLIDMLVALTLLAVMSGLMTVFLGQVRTIGRLQQDTQALNELDALLSYLQQSIGGAMPLALVQSPAERRRYLEGSASKMQFVEIARQGSQSYGLRETEIAVEGTGEAKTLVQSFRPRRLDRDAQATATVSVELATELHEVVFQYLSYEPSTHKRFWADDWRGRSDLPAAIRIRLSATRRGVNVEAEGQAILKFSVGSEAKSATPVGL